MMPAGAGKNGKRQRSFFMHNNGGEKGTFLLKQWQTDSVCFT
jgi:hypothetical protein